MKKIILVFLFSFFINHIFAQPFADILSFNCQTFSTNYKDSIASKNKTNNYFLNFFLPKEFKNGHTFLLRLNSELLNTSIKGDTAYSNQVSSVSMPIGIKLVSNSKKWETILIAVPKMASDFRDKINDKDFQMGGIFLQHYVYSEKLKIKLGLYYNREAFGNFYVPLAGVDWKINSRFSMYGILPTSYKAEYKIIKDKLYTGINLKYFTRSFRLSSRQNHDYVRYDEAQIKLFLDYFIYKKIILFLEAGYSIGKNPLQYKYETKDLNYQNNPIYSPAKPCPIFNFGLAYRVRLDLETKN